MTTDFVGVSFRNKRHILTIVLQLYTDVPPQGNESARLLSNDELNDEFHALHRQVVGNSIELQRFRKRVTVSRAHRKETLVKLDRKIDAVGEDPILPEDTYSFFAITRFKVYSDSDKPGFDRSCQNRRLPDLSFGLALFVLLLQVVTLTFLAVDVIDKDNKYNPLGMPAGVEWTVQGMTEC